MDEQNGDAQMKSLNILVNVIAMVSIAGCYGGRIIAERIDEPAPNREVIALEDAGITDAGVVTSHELEQALVDRWNAVPLASQRIDDGSASYDFLWPTFGEFPHPTYKGGSELAYLAFARVLLAFMQAGDNFEFLANNKTEYQGHASNLFDLRIGEAAAESGLVEAGWTFRELVGLFATAPHGMAYGSVDSDTRAGLAEVASRMP
jgi:hypothetical protein